MRFPTGKPEINLLHVFHTTISVQTHSCSTASRLVTSQLACKPTNIIAYLNPLAFAAFSCALYRTVLVQNRPPYYPNISLQAPPPLSAYLYHTPMSHPFLGISPCWAVMGRAHAAQHRLAIKLSVITSSPMFVGSSKQVYLAIYSLAALPLNPHRRYL